MLLGEVEHQLGAVGVELPRCEGVLDSDLVLDLSERWPDALHRHTAATYRCQHQRLGQADEGDRGLAAILRLDVGDDRLACDVGPTGEAPGVTLRPRGER